jgi:sensor histidine kinase YesM
MRLMQSKNLVYLAVPPVLGIVLHLIYVATSQFAEPSGFSIPFLLKEILLFYFYIYSLSKTYKAFEAKVGDTLSLSRHALVFLIAFAISLLVSLIVYSAMKQFYITVFHENDSVSLHHLTVRSLSTTAGFILIYSVFISNRYHSKAMSLELKEEQLQRERAEMKYQLLSNKVNPHFLFNNLNALHSLISEAPKAAEGFLMSLSKIMRYSFKNPENDMVELDEELSILEDYVVIMKSRFDNAISLTLKNESDPDATIIPMTLLNLMENAVKHNEISTQKPLTIQVEISKDFIVFSNNISPKIASESTGSGLNQLREMYAQKYRQQVLVEQTKNEFKVSVPLIYSNT